MNVMLQPASVENSFVEPTRRRNAMLALMAGREGGRPGVAPADYGPGVAPAGYGIEPSNSGLINALFSVESSSSLDNPDWDIRGPTVPTGRYAGERAIGPAQVMPGNIAPWSESHLGEPVDADELARGLASGDPEAQATYMRIVDGEVARLRRQGYSPEEIAIAWHSGEGGVNRYRAGRGAPRDTATGISTFGSGDTYVNRFLSAYRQR